MVAAVCERTLTIGSADVSPASPCRHAPAVHRVLFCTPGSANPGCFAFARSPKQQRSLIGLHATLAGGRLCGGVLLCTRT